MKPELEDEVNQLHANICEALGDAKRIMILYELSEGARTVTELAEAVHMPQSSVSRHLKLLREREMVLTTRQGPAVEYRIADQRIIEALDLLRAILRDHLSHEGHLAKAI